MWEEKLVIYDKFIATNNNFERKGKTMPYTSVNGYMFSMLNKDAEIGLRLPKESAEKFMEKYKTTRYKSHGAWIKDYVLIPEKLHKKITSLAPYLQESYEYTMSLPPKPGKKKK